MSIISQLKKTLYPCLAEDGFFPWTPKVSLVHVCPLRSFLGVAHLYLQILHRFGSHFRRKQRRNSVRSDAKGSPPRVAGGRAEAALSEPGRPGCRRSLAPREAAGSVSRRFSAASWRREASASRSQPGARGRRRRGEAGRRAGGLCRASSPTSPRPPRLVASALGRQRGPRGSLPGPARHAVPPRRRHGTAPPRAPPASGRLPPPARPSPPPRAPAGEGAVRRREETPARGNRRRDARGSLAARSWGQKPRLSGGGHVIPFKMAALLF